MCLYKVITTVIYADYDGTQACSAVIVIASWLISTVQYGVYLIHLTCSHEYVIVNIISWLLSLYSNWTGCSCIIC